MRATVVVVNWNGAHLIGPCLESLQRQTLSRDDWQVWVVDNNSTKDDSREFIKREHPWVRLIENSENLGFAGGNNAALREVSTPYAVLLNNDATPEPDWLENLLGAIDDPGAGDLGAVASKILFMPRFVRIALSTTGFSPGAHDSRELGVRIHSVRVDGHESVDHVLWEKLTYGPEGEGANRYRWTRPSGELLLPVEPSNGSHAVELTWASEVDKWVRLAWDGGELTLPVTASGSTVSFELPRTVPTVDVINNAGGVVFAEGYGADRGFQQVDDGQYDKPEAVFTACGNGCAIRSEIGHALGWFDDDFFLYYEDTDLFWRMRSRGHDIRYVPSAVIRHHHSASSGETSSVFQFHVARNRLMMLTKCASRQLALQQVIKDFLVTLSMLVRGVRTGIKERRRPPLRHVIIRLRALRSYLRHLPALLHRRRTFRRTSTVSRAELERWLVTPS